MLSDRANTLCLLNILQEYSDKNHILQMNEIISKYKSIYDIKINRRTVYSAIELLQTLDYNISSYGDNKKGYYLCSRTFESSEISLLVHAVNAFPFISDKHSKDLIDKLQGFLSKFERKKYKYLVHHDNKSLNKQFFWNVEKLDEAIENKNKVSFYYCTYDINRCLVARKDEPYIVSPYGMIYTNEHYYLICSTSNYTNINLYRIDRIKEISILDESVNHNESDIISDKLVGKSIYAFTGTPERIVLKFDKIILNDVIDKFGQDIHLSEDSDDNLIKVTFDAPPQGVKFWALQYLPYVELIKPEWLREEIIDSLNRNKYTSIKIV